jgi:hypothetical protein
VLLNKILTFLTDDDAPMSDGVLLVRWGSVAHSVVAEQEAPNMSANLA